MAARCFPRARPARVPHLLKDCASIGLPSVTRTATRQKSLVRASPSEAEATWKECFASRLLQGLHANQVPVVINIPNRNRMR